eukprot:GHVT01046008.1.p3 GENE.GHVT01046008.1~~GHVT01046008.1.p3  ORF type:complete len:101 (+),score=8.48 GHVT01046008.1:121-423(+)
MREAPAIVFLFLPVCASLPPSPFSACETAFCVVSLLHPPTLLSRPRAPPALTRSSCCYIRTHHCLSTECRLFIIYCAAVFPFARSIGPAQKQTLTPSLPL